MVLLLLQRDWMHNLWTASCNSFRISASISFLLLFAGRQYIYTFHDSMESASDPLSIATSHEIGQALVLLIWSTRIPFVHIFPWCDRPIGFNILHCYHTSIFVWFFMFFPAFISLAVLEQLIDETSFSGVILPSPEWNTLDHIGKNARITYRYGTNVCVCCLVSGNNANSRCFFFWIFHKPRKHFPLFISVLFDSRIMQ